MIMMMIMIAVLKQYLMQYYVPYSFYQKRDKYVIKTW